MKEKLITKQDLASFDNRIQETLEYYQDEVSQLKEKIAQKEAEKVNHGSCYFIESQINKP